MELAPTGFESHESHRKALAAFPDGGEVIVLFVLWIWWTPDPFFTMLGSW